MSSPASVPLKSLKGATLTLRRCHNPKPQLPQSAQHAQRLPDTPRLRLRKHAGERGAGCTVREGCKVTTQTPGRGARSTLRPRSRADPGPRLPRWARAARSNQGATGLAPRVSSPRPRRRDCVRRPRGEMPPPGPRSFFVKESAGGGAGAPEPAPRRSVQRPGVNGARPARGASARCPVTAAARGSRAPARSPAHSHQQPRAAGRIPTARGPTQGAPRAGGRPGAARAGRAGRAGRRGSRSPRREGRAAGGGPGDPQGGWALSLSAVAGAARGGCAPRVFFVCLFVTSNSWKAYSAARPCVPKRKSVFFFSFFVSFLLPLREGSLHPFKAKKMRL